MKKRPLIIILTLILSSSLFANAAERIIDMAPRLSQWNVKKVTGDAIAQATRILEDPFVAPNTTVVIKFPAGTFRFYRNAHSPLAAIYINDLKPRNNGALVIRGAGRNSTTFVIMQNQDQTNRNHLSNDRNHSKSQYGILCTNSRGITFEHLHLTVAQNTVSQGTVRWISRDRRQIHVEIDAGYALPTRLMADRQNNHGRWLRRYSDNGTGNPPIDVRFDHEEWTAAYEVAGLRRVRIDLVDSTRLNVNDRIGIKAKHGKDLYQFTDCNNMVMQHLGMSKKARGRFLRCRNVRIDRLVVGRQWVDGKPSFVATPGGGPQFHARQGGLVRDNISTISRIPGPVIKDCVFIGLGDDPIGIFEQRGSLIYDNVIVDSFGRGIFSHYCVGTWAPGEGQWRNILVRNDYERHDRVF